MAEQFGNENSFRKKEFSEISTAMDV